mmetsp:Transcript_62808/g.182182  ORF Transcript_62808/g.182182 Transcript_62808/m.182182 type:complete len:484 (-) Transcript_62808:208-1659(-)
MAAADQGEALGAGDRRPAVPTGDQRAAVFALGHDAFASRLRETAGGQWPPAPALGDDDACELLARLAVDVWPNPPAVDCVQAAARLAGLAGDAASPGGRIADLLLHIVRWAMEALADGEGAFPREVDLWAPGAGPRRIAYSARQCRGVMANALLSNVTDTTAGYKDRGNQGGLDFHRMLRARSEGPNKLACLLHYFDASRLLEGTEADGRMVTFERRAAPQEVQDLSDFRRWILEDFGKSAPAARCDLHDGGMESVPEAEAFVNFANPNFGYGRFIPSCTQEEILQVCCPEFNIGMLHQGLMRDEEVVNVYSVRRFSAYAGYLNSFTFKGPWAGEPSVQNILTMDATTESHFRGAMVLRDVRKAYLSFQGCGVVSTGRWGCGAFGGSPPHKLAQQIVAASLAGCELRFSSFGSLDSCDVVLEAVTSAPHTAADLLVALLAASATAASRTPQGFAEAFAKSLRSNASATHPARPPQPAGSCDMV